MSHFHIFYIVSILIHSIHTQQYFVTDQNYRQHGEAIIKVAYPINQCIKNGNDPYSQNLIYQCSFSGFVVYQCLSGLYECPAICDPSYYNYVAIAAPDGIC
eukprot:987120_1